MGLANSIEKRFRWISFPGLIRGIVILHFFTFFILVFRPGALDVFTFDWGKILSGEVWRIISFVLIPPILPGSILSYVFIFFILFIGFMIGDHLEHAWGAFGSSIYCYGLILAQIAANIIASLLVGSLPVHWGGMLLYEAFFLAFATLFPRYEFRAMLLFPIPVFILAIITVVGGLLSTLRFGPFAPFVILYFIICFLPYLAWAVPRIIGYLRNRSAIQKRQAAYQAKVGPDGEAFHDCESCGATELTHPDRDFRMTENDGELCSACLGDKS